MSASNFSEPEVAQDFYPFERFYFRVNVPALDTYAGHIIGQLFGHAFGEGGYQRSLVYFNPFSELPRANHQSD
jgi:hypothetical protein